MRFDTCDYSVHPKAIGRRIDVAIYLEWVVATLGNEEVARHKRSLCPHRTITAVDHARARRDLKGRHKGDRSQFEVEVEMRDLTVYDDAFGVA